MATIREFEAMKPKNVEYLRFKLGANRQVVLVEGVINIESAEGVPNWVSAKWDEEGKCMQLPKKYADLKEHYKLW